MKKSIIFIIALLAVSVCHSQTIDTLLKYSGDVYRIKITSKYITGIRVQESKKEKAYNFFSNSVLPCFDSHKEQKGKFFMVDLFWAKTDEIGNDLEEALEILNASKLSGAQKFSLATGSRDIDWDEVNMGNDYMFKAVPNDNALKIGFESVRKSGCETCTTHPVWLTFTNNQMLKFLDMLKE